MQSPLPHQALPRPCPDCPCHQCTRQRPGYLTVSHAAPLPTALWHQALPRPCPGCPCCQRSRQHPRYLTVSHAAPLLPHQALPRPRPGCPCHQCTRQHRHVDERRQRRPPVCAHGPALRPGEGPACQHRATAGGGMLLGCTRDRGRGEEGQPEGSSQRGWDIQETGARESEIAHTDRNSFSAPGDKSPRSSPFPSTGHSFPFPCT